MPTPVIDKVSEVCKVPKDRIEHLWERAKSVAKSKGLVAYKKPKNKHEKEANQEFYSYTMGIFKHMITKQCTAKLDWKFPERWIQEAAENVNSPLGYTEMNKNSLLLNPSKDKLFASESFGISSEDPEVVAVKDVTNKSGTEIELPSISKDPIPLDASFWLPLAASHYQISKNLNDYVLMVSPSMISSLPNTNGDSVDKSELLAFNPGLGMPAYRSFKGKPCVAGETLVSTEKGLLQIKDIRSKKAKTVLTKDGTAQIKGWEMTGYHPTVNVTTKSGKVVRATPDHPFLVMTPDCILKWKDAGDLNKEDTLLVRLGTSRTDDTNLFDKAQKVVGRLYEKKYQYIDQKSGNIWDRLRYKESARMSFPTKMTDSLARLLGYLVSEGHVVHNVAFHNTNKDLIDDYVSCFQKCFGETPTIKLRKTVDGVMKGETPDQDRVIHRSKQGYTAHYSGEDLQLWLKSIGLSLTTAVSKTVPQCILEAKRRHILQFLRAYIEGDGCISGYMVGMYTISSELAQQLKQLIEALGYTAFVSVYNSKTTQPNHHTLWAVQLTASEGLAFMREVGVVSDAKQKAMDKIEERRAKQPEKQGWVTHTRRIPHAKSWAKKIVLRHRTGKGSAMRYWNNKGKKLNISIDIIGNDRGKLTKPDNVRHMANLLEPLDPAYKSRLDALVGDFVFDPVESVTHNQVAEPVYDIQTTAEQFTANGVVVHNCFLEHQNQDITKAKGVILDVFLRPLKGFAGNRHAKLIQLLAFDKTKDPELCSKIENKDINTVSIGIYYARYACSLCGNMVSPTEGRPCAHTQLKVKTYMDPDSGRLVYRKCFSITAFETSVVSDPAYVSAIGEILRPSR